MLSTILLTNLSSLASEQPPLSFSSHNSLISLVSRGSVGVVGRAGSDEDKIFSSLALSRIESFFSAASWGSLGFSSATSDSGSLMRESSFRSKLKFDSNDSLIDGGQFVANISSKMEIVSSADLFPSL